MRFDFSAFLNAVENRVRRIEGTTLAAKLLLGSGVAALLVNLVLILAFRGVPSIWGYVVPAVVLVAVPVGYVIGWARRPAIPRVLLSLDDALGSHARISSLYEVLAADRDDVFRDRLQQAVTRDTVNWKRGLRVPKRTLQTLSAGAVGLLVACALPLLPLPQPDVVASAIPSGIEASGSQAFPSALPGATHPEDSGSRDDTPAPIDPDQLDISPRRPTTEMRSAEGNDELTLDSILDELSSLSEGQAQVDAAPTSDELMELAAAQEEARQALTEMLEELREQMGGSPRPLTQQESRTLQDMASQTGDPEIEERTDELVDEPNPDQVGEKLQDLLEELDPDAQPPETSPETDEDGDSGPGSSDAPQSTEISGDEEAGQRFLERTAEQLQEQADSETQGDSQPQGQMEPRDDSEADDENDEEGPDTRMAGEPDDLAQQGGSDGIGGIDEEPPAGEVGFVREEAPSTVGQAGEFLDEFVTKGVPVELATTSDGVLSQRIDFDQMASIVRDRGLPEEALESVRRYFELITDPEGGS